MEITVKNTHEFLSAIKKVHTVEEEAVIHLLKGEYEILSEIKIKRDNLSIIGEEGVRLKGSKRISLENARKEGNLLVLDLEKEEISDLGEFGLGPFTDFWLVHDIPKPHMTDKGPGLELFYEGKRMTLSRYPKEGFLHIKESLGATPTFFYGKKNGSLEGVFRADDETISCWKNPEEWLLVGYWSADWATERHKVKSFQSGIFEVEEPYHYMGYRDGECFTTTEGAPFYILNAKEAVTVPGEWAIDRSGKKLYLYPRKGQEYVEISCAENLISGEERANIRIENLVLTECRKSGVLFENSSGVLVSNLSVLNVGGWGILGESCTDMSVDSCSVSLTGGGGIGVNGGDRETLKASGNTVKKCTVHDIALWHKTYMAALDISGVGCTLSENYIYDVPHFGIVYAGNNHLIEKNEIKNACFESNDAGAVYSGRNYTFRGNIIRYNYLHDLAGFMGRGCVGLYFDDAVSSAEVYGNTLENIPYIGLLLGGGRDFNIHHNTFKNCKMAVMYDKRASTWESFKHGGGRLAERLAEVPWQGGVWKKAYPKLYSIRENDMLLPLGNTISDNQIVGGDGFALSDKELLSYTEMKGNSFSRINTTEPHDKYHADWHYVTEDTK